jgi:hypothetical protein
VKAAPAVPSHAARAARGPKPPDAVVLEFRRALELELATAGIGGLTLDAKPKLAPVGSDGTPISLAGLSHEMLSADTFRPGVIERLRADPTFRKTGAPGQGRGRTEQGDAILIRKRSPDGRGMLKGEGWFLVDGSHRLQAARDVGLTELPAKVLGANGDVIFEGRIPIAEKKFVPSKKLEKAANKAANGVARAARRGVVQALPRLAADVPASVPAKRVAGFAEALLTAVAESVTKAVASGNPGRALESAAGVAQDLAQRESASQVKELAEGVTGFYVWTSELDRIVRPGHAALEGTIQSWADPPDTGDGYRAHAGEPRNCRCIPVPWDPGP